MSRRTQPFGGPERLGSRTADLGGRYDLDGDAVQPGRSRRVRRRLASGLQCCAGTRPVPAVDAYPGLRATRSAIAAMPSVPVRLRRFLPVIYG
jgi:hypothetical protein